MDFPYFKLRFLEKMDKNEILDKQISGLSKEHLCQYVGDI